MGTHFQIIDMTNPERIELYALEDLPDTLHQCVEAHGPKPIRTTLPWRSTANPSLTAS